MLDLPSIGSIIGLEAVGDGVHPPVQQEKKKKKNIWCVSGQEEAEIRS